IPLSLDGDEARALGVRPGPITAAILETILAGDAKTGGIALLLRLATPPSSITDDEAETVALLAALRRALIPDRLWRRVRPAADTGATARGRVALGPVGLRSGLRRALRAPAGHGAGERGAAGRLPVGRVSGRGADPVGG